MKCPQCVTEKRASIVYIGETVSTSTMSENQSFYDENGYYHNHNSNDLKTRYRCTNDHKWMQSTVVTCPTCT